MRLRRTVTGNNMQDLSFVSETYSKRKPKDCRLSISVRRDGFSFLIQHKQNVEAYAYTTVPSRDKEEAFRNFLSQEILQQKFGAVTVIIVTDRYTLVPKSFYSDSMVNSYANFNFSTKESEAVISYESINTDAVVLFPIETAIWSLCRSTFKAQEMVSYIPQVAPIMEANFKTKGEKLCVSVENTYFTSLFVKDKQIRFSNVFKFKNVNDFTFYIMNIFEQLHLDPLKVTVELSGKITKKSPHFAALCVFVKHVTIVPSLVTLPKFPHMLFYNHLNSALCE